MRRHGHRQLTALSVASIMLMICCKSQLLPPTDPLRSLRARLPTRYTNDVDLSSPLPEFPRPQLIRPDAPWLSLNGPWEWEPHDQDDTEPPFGTELAHTILVPFPPEASLSGINQTGIRYMWYRAEFEMPFKAAPGQVLLHFGAVDWQCTVYLNQVKIGIHRGGYDAFTYVISKALDLSQDGLHEIVLDVFDPTETADGVPLGKQRAHSPVGGITYTATSGIWQTVWLEVVPEAWITRVDSTPNIDRGCIDLTIRGSASASNRLVVAIVRDANQGNTTLGSGLSYIDAPFSVPVPQARLWSPASPYLYNLDVYLFAEDVTVSKTSPSFGMQGILAAPDFDMGTVSDMVITYFGMREISACRGSSGYLRACLNNVPIFMLGVLDQGYWPDGVYTAPTDQAMVDDILAAKAMGFNTFRKHMKIEPARWYFHADTQGMMIWQDMPAMCGMEASVNAARRYTNDPKCWDYTPQGDHPVPASAKRQFTKDLIAMIDGLQSFPSIVMWVIFNEDWGQYPDSAVAVGAARERDYSRLINGVSGWNHGPPFRGIGNVLDLHDYARQGPDVLNSTPAVAAPGGIDVGTGNILIAVVGEAGGIGFYSAQEWDPRFSFSNIPPDEVPTENDWLASYRQMLGKIQGNIPIGLSAAIYTELTDVEWEINGILTYARVQKIDPSQIAAINLAIFQVPL